MCVCVIVCICVCMHVNVYYVYDMFLYYMKCVYMCIYSYYNLPIVARPSYMENACVKAVRMVH